MNNFQKYLKMFVFGQISKSVNELRP